MVMVIYSNPLRPVGISAIARTQDADASGFHTGASALILHVIPYASIIRPQIAFRGVITNQQRVYMLACGEFT
jgi:hypothetical protein